MTKTQWKKIAIGLSAAFGIACCLATSEVGQYGKNVMVVDYADTLTFELSAGESVSYSVSHSCDASKMPDGEPISILTTGTIVANLPDDAPEAGLITVLFKNQDNEENEQSLSITPGVPADLVRGKAIFKTWLFSTDTIGAD